MTSNATFTPPDIRFANHKGVASRILPHQTDIECFPASTLKRELGLGLHITKQWLGIEFRLVHTIYANKPYWRRNGFMLLYWYPTGPRWVNTTGFVPSDDHLLWFTRTCIEQLPLAQHLFGLQHTPPPPNQQP